MAEEEGEMKVKRMAEYRSVVEKRIRETAAELEELKALLALLDNTLLEKGFKKAKIGKPTLPSSKSIEETVSVAPSETLVPSAENEEAVPLKTVTGDLLANLFIDEDSIRVVISEDKHFDINTPPFTSFLVDRVLAKMQERDREAARAGEISPDKVLSYSIVRDGEEIREIEIRNIASDRSRELRSTIRWTLEKMNEKVKMDS